MGSQRLSCITRSPHSQDSSVVSDARMFPTSTDGIVTKKPPNWLLKVQEGLAKDRQKDHSQPITPLSRTGAHVMRSAPEGLLDLAPMGCALVGFNEHRERCRITSF